MLAALFIAAAVFFLAAYRLYGGVLEKALGLPSDCPTPAHQLKDGRDFAPANRFVLFGHHFSSIAGAGPIVGPILASLLFGWAPALVWILLGSVFFGGVHDFASLAASLKNQGRSVAELAKQYVGPVAYRLLLVFIWLTLVYVLVAFLDLTADTFAKDASVASASVMYIGLAVVFGLLVTKARLNLLVGSLVFVPLVFGAVVLSRHLPLTAPAWVMADPKRTWSLLLIAYMFLASVLPVWLLLQPRDYLSSFLLYASVALGAVGLLFGRFPVEHPPFKGFVSADGQSLFPILFVTVACGAISGFHSLVSSGTSSKQLDRECDAKFVGYGGMLMEGLVAVIATATVMMIPASAAKTPPATVFAAGIGRFANLLGIPLEAGTTLGFLILSTFLLTTLDTATRISRYVLQELLGWDIAKTRYLATAASVALPLLFSLLTFRDAAGQPVPAYRLIWPVFGASNQLLAAMVLLVVSVWLGRQGRNPLFAALPMAFMLVVTLYALILLLNRYRTSAVGIIAAVLVLLAIYLAVVSFRSLLRRPAP